LNYKAGVPCIQEIAMVIKYKTQKIQFKRNIYLKMSRVMTIFQESVCKFSSKQIIKLPEEGR